MARDWAAEYAARKERAKNATTEAIEPVLYETTAEQADTAAEQGDGPTQIDPIPPPIVEGERKRRGRPPGVKNGEGTGARARARAERAAPVIDVADVKREIANAGALLAGLAHKTKWEPLAASLEWHKPAFDEKGNTVIAPSQKVDKAIDLMAPYMAESGMLDLVQLSPSGRFAIGCGILLAPTVLVGFQMLWTWAMHPPKAAATVVPMKKEEKAQA